MKSTHAIEVFPSLHIVLLAKENKPEVHFPFTVNEREHPRKHLHAQIQQSITSCIYLLRYGPHKIPYSCEFYVLLTCPK